MMISELVKSLQEAMEKHGDMPVMRAGSKHCEYLYYDPSVSVVIPSDPDEVCRYSPDADDDEEELYERFEDEIEEMKDDGEFTSVEDFIKQQPKVFAID